MGEPMSQVNYANRGMGLESLIEYANEQYSRKGIANIKKVSVPWKITRDHKGKINGAFPEGQSTVDYMGDYKGISVCFEAKETENKTSFPLSNFEPHQIEFIRKWQGIAFAIIHFKSHNKTFFLEKNQLINSWDQAQGGNRKSIPYKWFEDWTDEIDQNNGIVLDYLSHLTEVTE